MVLLSFWDVGPLLTEQQLVDTELRIGLKVPEQYRCFLREQNGGKPEPDGFWIYERDQRTRADWSKVTRFIGVDVGGHHDLAFFAANLADILPPDLFPIGDDLAGNVIAISTRPADDGAILYWNHEYEDQAEPNPAAMFYLAADLDAFLSGLTWEVGDEP